MGLLDAILGRSKPVRPDLDQLFAVPSAALTLQAATGFTPTGLGSVCFAGVEGGGFARLQEDVRELLDADTERGGIPVEFSRDAYGYTWLLASHPADDTAGLVNDLHAVNTLLQDGGFGPHLLCSLIGLPMRRSPCAHSTTSVIIRGPSARSTTAATYGTRPPKGGRSLRWTTDHV
ncbi:hypothetical protein SCYAM73S_00746 [Streptomyces cyaneofuscatus]